jgi:hypothetical protein
MGESEWRLPDIGGPGAVIESMPEVSVWQITFQRYNIVARMPLSNHLPILPNYS